MASQTGYSDPPRRPSQRLKSGSRFQWTAAVQRGFRNLSRLPLPVETMTPPSLEVHRLFAGKSQWLPRSSSDLLRRATTVMVMQDSCLSLSARSGMHGVGSSKTLPVSPLIKNCMLLHPNFLPRTGRVYHSPPGDEHPIPIRPGREGHYKENCSAGCADPRSYGFF